MQQILGCNIITALMQEYATTVKSSDVGLTWETHFKAKKQFEVQYSQTETLAWAMSLTWASQFLVTSQNITANMIHFAFYFIFVYCMYLF